MLFEHGGEFGRNEGTGDEEEAGSILDGDDGEAGAVAEAEAEAAAVEADGTMEDGSRIGKDCSKDGDCPGDEDCTIDKDG